MKNSTKKKLVATFGLTIALSLAVGTAAEAKKPVTNLRRGLYCKDIKRLGYSYPQAVAYWYYWDEPENMDADLDGIPCETIYSAQAVENYWG
jgi:Excalibur calcium-binding domain